MPDPVAPSATDSAPTPIDNCGSVLPGDGRYFGTWIPACASPTRLGSNGGVGSYAKFYTFTVAQQSQVTIDLRSDVDTFLFLRRRANQRSFTTWLHNDDGGVWLNSRITVNLRPGDYTIEASTYHPRQTGTFELELSGAGTASTPPAVPDPVTPPAPDPVTPPAPAPTPTPTDACSVVLSGDGQVSGPWASDCVSQERSGRYARFYIFAVEQRTAVTIDLGSSVDAYLYLRYGADQRSGHALVSDDDGGTGRNSRIIHTVDPGVYTIEATTYYQGRAGSFQLGLSGADTAPASTAEPASTSACGSTLSGDTLVSEAWTPACTSLERTDRYARFYTFTVVRRGLVSIDLTSDVDTYLYLRRGSDQRSDPYLRRDDDGGDGTNSAISDLLDAGVYTIEATTYDTHEPGAFRLNLFGTGR